MTPFARASLLWVALLACCPACRPSPSPDGAPIHPVRPRPPAARAPAPPPPPLPAAPPGTPAPVAGVLIGHWPEQGPLVSLHEQRAPIRAVLDRLARLGHLNFVLADEVRGEVTCAIDRVPWTEALTSLLLTKNLRAKREGNVVYIEPR